MSETERWAPIAGFDGKYEVSTLGRVRSFAQYQEGKLLKPCMGTNGYLSVSLCPSRGRTKNHSIHRLVLATFVGTPRPGMQGCHNNGDREDNRLSNLRWDTASENMYDVVRHGRHEKALRSHCPRGHELSGDNLVKSQLKTRGRSCRACDIGWSRVQSGSTVGLQAESDAAYERIVTGTVCGTPSERTHCIRGHVLESPNLQPSGIQTGHRKCKACDRAASWVSRHPGSSLQVEADRYYEAIMCDEAEKAGRQ